MIILSIIYKLIYNFILFYNEFVKNYIFFITKVILEFIIQKLLIIGGI